MLMFWPAKIGIDGGTGGEPVGVDDTDNPKITNRAAINRCLLEPQIFLIPEITDPNPGRVTITPP